MPPRSGATAGSLATRLRDLRPQVLAPNERCFEAIIRRLFFTRWIAIRILTARVRRQIMRGGFGDHSTTNEAVARRCVPKSAATSARLEQRLHRGNDLLASVALSQRGQNPTVVCVVVADFNGPRTSFTVEPVIVAKRRMDHPEKANLTCGASDNSRIESVVIGHRFTQASELVIRPTWWPKQSGIGRSACRRLSGRH